MKVIVTGAEGYLGKELCNKLKSLGIDIYRIDKKLGIGIETITDLEDADVVIHLAGVSRRSMGEQNPKKCFRSNIMDTVHLCECVMAKEKKPRMVYISSIDADKGDQAYGVSKLCAERICLYYQSKGLNIIILRLPSIIGKGMPKDNIYMRIAKGELKINDTKINYMFLDDVVDEIIRRTNPTVEQYKIFSKREDLKTVIEKVKEMNNL